MALSNRNDIRFRKSGNDYIVLANTFTETSGFKFTSAYGVVAYQFVESSSATGISISSNGTLTCSQLIEGEPS